MSSLVQWVAKRLLSLDAVRTCEPLGGDLLRVVRKEAPACVVAPSTNRHSINAMC